jgi:hypothetical protein
MADRGHRTYLREASGPRPVESNHSRDKNRGSGRRHHSKEYDDREKHSSRKTSQHKSPKTDSTHRRKSSNVQTTNIHLEKPSIQLDVIGQPAPSIHLGMQIEKAVMISLKLPSADQRRQFSQYETSNLFAISSLVAESRSGERVTLEPGTMTSQKALDSIHPIPDHVADSLARKYPSQLALGYFTFSDLMIRQIGTFRIRTTLVKMGETGATSLAAIDSEIVKVEGRVASHSHRRHQRVYA